MRRHDLSTVWRNITLAVREAPGRFSEIVGSKAGMGAVIHHA